METIHDYIKVKLDSSETSIVQDEKEKFKSYILEDGFIVGIQINTGSTEVESSKI